MSSLTQSFIGVPELVAKYGLTAFIETGIEDGVSTQVARDLGLSIYGCDVDGVKVDAARNRFPRAQISHATSIDFLLDVLPQITEPTLLWLDAHFTPLMPPDDQWPLRHELMMVSMMLKSRDRSVIIADDYSCVLSTSLTDFDPEALNGDGRFCDYSHGDLCRMLPYHDARVIAENTGVCVWTPRAEP